MPKPNLSAREGADDHVAAGPHLSVALNNNTVAEAVEHERLLRFGKADLPGLPACFMEGAGWRRCPVVSADEDSVGIAFGDARGDRADATSERA